MSDKDLKKQILKATSLFGGVQVFGILVTILRSKFIAVFLGPIGIGISSMLTATTSLIAACTHFGLGTSAVRDIAAANSSGDFSRVERVVTVFRKLVWYTGILSASICLVSAYWLSSLTFGNHNYTLAFAILSVTLLVDQLTKGRAVLMQGLRQFKYMAKASIIGSLVGLVFSIPLYYFFKIDAIVPTLVITSFTAYIIEWYFSRKIKIKEVIISQNEFWQESKGMLKLGFMLSLSGLVTLAASYILRLFISQTGSLSDVGLYSAGFAIITSYVGLVLSSMSTDYFPRLSGVAHDNKQSSLLVNHQAEIGLLILSPILVGFMIFINFIIVLLYSYKFIPIQGMLHWAALGMYFKAMSWSMAFLFLAKGDSKAFFWNELTFNIYLLLFNVAGYYFSGLEGLGISFLIGYVIYFIQVYFFVKHRYNFIISAGLIKLAAITFLLGLLGFSFTYIFTSFYYYLFGSILVLIAAAYSIYNLDKIIDIKSIVLRRK